MHDRPRSPARTASPGAAQRTGAVHERPPRRTLGGLLVCLAPVVVAAVTTAALTAPAVVAAGLAGVVVGVVGTLAAVDRDRSSPPVGRHAGDAPATTALTTR